MLHKEDCFIPFKQRVAGITLPQKFTFPFCYEVHPIAKIAAEELQAYIQHQNDWQHRFWDHEKGADIAIGKMFGVLVVQKTNGDLGYLAAFSGKIAQQNIWPYFVPPVYDILSPDGFYLKKVEEIKKLNQEMEKIENNPDFIALQKKYHSQKHRAEADLKMEKSRMKAGKQKRDEIRQKAKKELSEVDYQKLWEQLKEESLKFQFYFKELSEDWNNRIDALANAVKEWEVKLETLKAKRKLISLTLQQKIFKQYSFLNAENKEKSLFEIFNLELKSDPPSGAGECAAPKLLQFAYLNNLKPIALAEFWWGKSPASELRKHLNFYPACRGKCLPILGHMLKGLKVDEDPLLKNWGEAQQLEIVYEDDFLIAVNKPPELLSVPGIHIQDSVFTRLQMQFQNIEGPFVVHRLDMSTSGIMLFAKTKSAHQFLQAQFIRKKIKKEYLALLEGKIDKEQGKIELPIRVDLNDRPRQLVCYEHGKKAITYWEKIKEEKEGTKVKFYPITGRTHQLRVHAAHFKGLDAPIVGDDLYGSKKERLFLHAEKITFYHPLTMEEMTLIVPAAF